MARRQQENTLGAPTEGLGQNVTFQADGLGAPSQMDTGAGVVPVRAGVIGADFGNAPVGRNGPTFDQDPTLGALVKIGGHLIAPHVKKMQAERYVEGMQLAMTGKALEDIARDEPWYAKVFGNADAVEGARAYNIEAGVANTVASLETDMDSLRKMAPQEASAEYNRRVAAGLTGDKATDMYIMQGVTRQLPAVMRRQAKEHYGYLQEEASKAQSSYMDAAASAFDSARDGIVKGTVTPEELEGRSQTLVRAILPAAGQNEEEWKKNTAGFMRKLLSQDRLHSYNAIKKSGVLGQLTEDQQRMIESASETAEARVRAQAPVTLAPQLAALKATLGRTTSPAEGMKEIERINKDFAASTGSTRPYITADTASSMLAEGFDRIYADDRRLANEAKAAAAKAATAEEKKVAEERAAYQAMHLIYGGQDPKHKRLDGRDIDVAWDMIRTQGPQQWENAALAFYKGTQQVDKVAAQQWRGTIEGALGSKNPALIEQLLPQYMSMFTKSESTADAYMGPDLELKMRAYVMFRGDNPAAAGAAFDRAFVQPLKLGEPTKDQREEALKHTKDYVNSNVLMRTIGMTPDKFPVNLSDREAERLSSFVQKDMQVRLPYHRDVKSAAIGSIEAFRRRGGDIVGGYVMQRDPNEKPLAALLDGEVPERQLHTSFAKVVGDKLAAVGGGTATAVSRQGDTKEGKARFMVTYDNDGTLDWFTFTSDDVVSEYKRDKAERDKPALSGVKAGTRAATPTIPVGTPSIYAPPEEWAAYRKRNK